MRASASARSAAAIRRAISTLLAACCLSFPMRSKLSKVIVGSDQKDLPVGHDTLQKRFSCSSLGREFVGWIHVWIDLPS
jgi:hypothetical protein